MNRDFSTNCPPSNQKLTNGTYRLGGLAAAWARLAIPRDSAQASAVAVSLNIVVFPLVVNERLHREKALG